MVFARCRGQEQIGNSRSRAHPHTFFGHYGTRTPMHTNSSSTLWLLCEKCTYECARETFGKSI